MSVTSIGDLAQSFMLRRHTAGLKTTVQTLSNEMVTGVATDTARKTHGDLAPLNAIDSTLARLTAYGAATSEAAVFAETMQTALTGIESMTSDLGPTLLTVANTGNAASVTNLGKDARQKFESAVATFNTRVGDRSLFAGQATDAPALADAETILSALDTAIIGAVSAGDIETAVTNWFNNPAGFATVGYLGGASLSPLPIAAGEETTIDITAADPAIRDTLKGLALAALLDRGALAGSPAGRADLARRAGESLINTQADRAHLASGLGIVENQIEQAKARNSAEASSLQIARLGIVAVDPYETASKLEETQTQLETLYSITARLSRLSLMDFLR